MVASLRRFYWKLKYRSGCQITFCAGYDLFLFYEILVVENRVDATGTLIYRVRPVNVFGGKQVKFGPLCEDEVPEMVRRLTNISR